MTFRTKIVVVAGANGQLGQLLVAALADRAAQKGEAVEVRALVRKGRNLPEATPGVVWQAVDYQSRADLDRACAGAFAVVSTLIGVDDVIVDTQTRLLQAAITAGARRFIPSDFSGDFTKLPEGSHRNFDMRRRFHRIAAWMIAKSGAKIDFTSIYQGGFTELLASGWVLFDYKKRRVNYFGAADVPLEFTTYANTAEYTAAVALDDNPTPTALHIAGARLSPQTAVTLAKRVLGADFALKRVMPVGMLRLVIAVMKWMKPDPANPMPLWVAMQYGYVGALGLMSPPALQNTRYDGIDWTGPDAVVATAYVAAGGRIETRTTMKTEP